MSIEVPETTELIVIFPAEGLGRAYTFHTQKYHPQDTDHRVSLEQASEILAYIGIVVKQHLKCVELLLILHILLMVVGPFSVGLFKDRDFVTYLLVGDILFGIIMLFCLIIIQAKRKYQAMQICQQYLNTENQKIASNGVRWVLPEEHFPSWIEIHNDFRRPNYTAHNFTIHQANPFVEPPKPPEVEIQIPNCSGMQTQSHQYTFNNFSSNAYQPPHQYHQTSTGGYEL